MPAVVSHAVAWWAALYSGSAVLRTLVSFVHVAGLVSGGGAAVVADRATLKATRRGLAVTRQQLIAIHNTHRGPALVVFTNSGPLLPSRSSGWPA